MRLWKILLALIVLALAGLAGYTFLGDMEPRQSEMCLPVDLGTVDGAPVEFSDDGEAIDGDSAESEASDTPADTSDTAESE